MILFVLIVKLDFINTLELKNVFNVLVIVLPVSLLLIVHNAKSDIGLMQEPVLLDAQLLVA